MNNCTIFFVRTSASSFTLLCISLNFKNKKHFQLKAGRNRFSFNKTKERLMKNEVLVILLNVIVLSLSGIICFNVYKWYTFNCIGKDVVMVVLKKIKIESFYLCYPAKKFAREVLTPAEFLERMRLFDTKLLLDFSKTFASDWVYLAFILFFLYIWASFSKKKTDNFPKLISLYKNSKFKKKNLDPIFVTKINKKWTSLDNISSFPAIAFFQILFLAGFSNILFLFNPVFLCFPISCFNFRKLKLEELEKLMKKKEFSLADYELFKSVDNMLFSVSCRIKIVENIKSLFNFSLLFAVFVYFLSFVYLLIPRLGYLWACYYFIYILKIKKFALIADPFNFITFCDGCMIVCSKIAIIVYLFFLTFLRMTFYLFLVDPFLRVWLVLITNLTRFMFLFFLLISFSLTKAKINFIFKENKFFMSTIKTSHLKLGALNVLISKENFLIYLILEMNRIAEVRKTYFGIQTIEEITIEKG